MIEQIDHIAVGIQDLDERIAFYTGQMGLVLKRRGVHMASGGRIAMVMDPKTSLKLELIETPDRRLGLMHVAFRVDDVGTEFERLRALGLVPAREPFWLEAAKAETALFADPAGVGTEVQIIRYAPDSPDV